MLPWESRRKRRNGRAGRQPGRMALERLEGRELMAYTPLGLLAARPDGLGVFLDRGGWAGPLTVTLERPEPRRQTLIAPTALLPGATSPADAPADHRVGRAVSPKGHPKRTSSRSGSIAVPARSAQNSLVQVSQTLTLPNQPSGFPGDGGKVYVSFLVNPNGNVDRVGLHQQPRPEQQQPAPDRVAVPRAAS